MLAWVLIGTTASIRNAPVTFTVALPLVNERALIVGGFAGVLPWAASGDAKQLVDGQGAARVAEAICTLIQGR